MVLSTHRLELKKQKSRAGPFPERLKIGPRSARQTNEGIIVFSSNSQIMISGPGSLGCRHCRLFVMLETKGLGLYNVVIIGAGTAGLVTAADTAGLGGRVALVERNKMGGDCLNYGCVPSKALIASARVIDSIRHASRWGLARAAIRIRNSFRIDEIAPG